MFTLDIWESSAEKTADQEILFETEECLYVAILLAQCKISGIIDYTKILARLLWIQLNIGIVSTHRSFLVINILRWTILYFFFKFHKNKQKY